MSKITDWTAVRSGALITVSGKGASGEPVRLTKVERIEGTANGTVAVRGDDRFELLAGNLGLAPVQSFGEGRVGA